MDEIDTSTPAVEKLRVVKSATRVGIGTRDPRDYLAAVTLADCIEAAALLRALATERDGLAHKAADMEDQWRGAVLEMVAQRDAALAEAARLRALLVEAEADLAAFVNAEYAGTEAYPDQMRRKDRDMDLVRRIRAALDGERKA